MTLMDVRIFVTAGVYAVAMLYISWLAIAIPAYLSEPRNRTKVKRKILRTIRNFLKLFMKTEP